MAVTCIIRYEIDPFQREAFNDYAQRWGRIIPRCGGDLVGYFLPYEGTDNVAWGLIAFDSLASYEAYRARLKSDPEGSANFAMARAQRFIVREERSFVESVDGTFRIPAHPGQPGQLSHSTGAEALCSPASETRAGFSASPGEPS